MSKHNLPAIQFYPGDWRKNPRVQALNYHDRGVWFEMLMLMHESDERGKLLLNGKAMPEDALARILGLDNQTLTTTLSTLLTYGVAVVDEQTGAISCRRMIEDERVRQLRISAGKLGGNPVLLKQKDKHTANLKPTPSSSSSKHTDTLFGDVSDSSSKRKVSEKTVIDRWFDADFWPLYPRKVGKDDARKAAQQKATSDELRAAIIAGLKRQLPSLRKKDPEFLKYPAGWLRGGHWTDEEATTPAEVSEVPRFVRNW